MDSTLFLSLSLTGEKKLHSRILGREQEWEFEAGICGKREFPLTPALQAIHRKGRDIQLWLGWGWVYVYVRFFLGTFRSWVWPTTPLNSKEGIWNQQIGNDFSFYVKLTFQLAPLWYPRRWWPRPTQSGKYLLKFYVWNWIDWIQQQRDILYKYRDKALETFYLCDDDEAW